MKLKEKLIKAAAVFATTVGLLKVVGLLSGVHLFVALAQTLAISPAPDPYTKVFTDTTEPLQWGATFGCEGYSGQGSWHHWNYKLRAALPGPHRRIVTYVHYFSSLRKHRALPESEDEQSPDYLTRYYFCHGGPLAAAAGCPEDLKAVFLDAPSPPGLQAVVHRRVLCSE